VIPKTTWEQTPDGLRLRAMRAQRLSDDRLWPNPVVLKLTRVQPALRVARVETLDSRWREDALTLTGAVSDLGSATRVEAGFEYRDITGMDTHERTGAWQRTAFKPLNTAGEFTMDVPGLRRDAAYEFRAVARHTGLDFFGAEQQAKQP
jgi:alpha-L-fucosidase